MFGENYPICLSEMAGWLETKADYDQSFDAPFTVSLSHTFDENGDDFHSRGIINIRSLKTNNYVTNQHPLKEEDLKKLKDNYENGVYRLEVVVKTGNDVYGPFRTFLPMCLLHESDLMDRLTIHFGPTSVMGVTVHGESSVCNGYEEKNLTTFKTRVGYTFTEQGIQPDTSSFIQRMEQEKIAKQQGEAKDNRGFFAKYWMYIVPFVIFILISSAGQEPQGGS